MAALSEFSRYLFQLGYHDAYLVPPKQMSKLHLEPPYFFDEEELFGFLRECDAYFKKNTGPGVLDIDSAYGLIEDLEICDSDVLVPVVLGALAGMRRGEVSLFAPHLCNDTKQDR